MKILKFLTNANAFMTEDFRFFKTKPVSDNREDASFSGNRKLLIREIEPSYKNDYIEIFVIERSIFQPYYFAVKTEPDGGRKLYADVFGKKLFPYKIQMLGQTDFAVAWLGETRRLNEDGKICFEDVQNDVGENWHVYMLSDDGRYDDVSSSLGSDREVHISSLKYDDGILKISLMAQGGTSCEKDVLFIRDKEGYRRINQEECDAYWREVCEKRIPASSWFPASPEMFCNLQDFAEVV